MCYIDYERLAKDIEGFLSEVLKLLSCSESLPTPPTCLKVQTVYCHWQLCVV